MIYLLSFLDRRDRRYSPALGLQRMFNRAGVETKTLATTQMISDKLQIFFDQQVTENDRIIILDPLIQAAFADVKTTIKPWLYRRPTATEEVEQAISAKEMNATLA